MLPCLRRLYRKLSSDEFDILGIFEKQGLEVSRELLITESTGTLYILESRY